jgi:predicted lactoylglutathione lyase
MGEGSRLVAGMVFPGDGGATEALVCLSVDSREHVDAMVRKAVAAGGSTYNAPQDHGFMYGHGFQDLDGRIWELIFMEPGASQQG